MNSLLAVFAHPDDETFRPGGTLALLARHGVKVNVLTLTHGEAGSCGEPALCTPGDLSVVREAELRCACNALGLQPPRLLGYPDGGLEIVEPQAIITQILSVVEAVRAQVMLSFGPDGLSGHPDHIFIGKCALEAFHRAANVAVLYTLAIPVSTAHHFGMRQIRAIPDTDVSLAIDVLPVWEKKLAAIRCHATQMSSTPMLNVSQERQRLFFGREYFVRAALRAGGDDFLPCVLSEYLKHDFIVKDNKVL